MPRRKSNRGSKPLKEANHLTNILQSNKVSNEVLASTSRTNKPRVTSQEYVDEIVGIKSILDDENQEPGTSSSLVNDLTNNTADLHNELDSFRLRWRRELGVTRNPDSSEKQDTDKVGECESTNNIESTSSSQLELPENNDRDKIDDTYAEAKKLFLKAVALEQDEMHHESIRYYKQAMHLQPDIEKRIFREQCEESARLAALEKNTNPDGSRDCTQSDKIKGNNCDKRDLYDRIFQNHCESNKDETSRYCKPHKQKRESTHISDLPEELLMLIIRHVIGEELDLASLETIGLVCRGFYLLSRHPSFWRSVCYATWGDEILRCEINAEKTTRPIDWRSMYLNKPRVNFDGVYISRTRYIRQGDVGFQDITYRPFHVVRYYRYLRFFPDKRVLILTTNEEPDKIVPIFRHAIHSKQFSPELSILEGTYELIKGHQINIVAEKDCRSSLNVIQNQRRHITFHWSRQTPLTQKFNLKFDLKTLEGRPYKNNALKWLEYTILARLETGQEVTSFDLTPDTFPNLHFSRVKRFNLRSANPLSSH